MSLNLNNQIAIRKNKSIYKDDNKIIKLFNSGHPKSFVLNEALNQARVEGFSNLNVPRLLEVTKVDDRWALVSEFVEGKTISTLMKEYPEKIDHYLELFVKVQLVVLENEVPMLNRIKEKFREKLEKSDNIDENIKYELLQRLEGMKNHKKLCHGDFHPSNVIVQENGNVYVIDWSHVTQGNASADAARTFLLFSMDGKEELAEQYLDLFSNMSGIEKSEVQRWIPIVAATQLTKKIPEEQEFLNKWINVVDYE
jgi:tRNA A-37 threonylcarbamoyl transferase component Bud32